MSGKRKLAIIMITTHGNLDPLDDKINHDGEITVRKINATSHGVCNWTSPEGLNEMIGQRMNRYIENNKKEEEKDCIRRGISYNPDNILCLQGTDKQQQRQIQNFSESLRTYMPTIDDVHKDTTNFIVKTAKGKPVKLESFDEEYYGDEDLHKYIQYLPESYQLEPKWEKYHEYYDKIYTIIRSELVGEEVSAIDNTMFFLGDKRLPQLPLPGLPIGRITRGFEKGDDITFNLSEILEKLKELGYTDTIIIDLSCNAGFDPRSARRLFNPRKGGKRKSKKSKRRSKRTRKHRKK